MCIRDSYLGGHDMVANSPALADGSGTAGDTYYVTNPGTRNYGSGNITAQEGDALVYSGSVWQLVEGIANILDGISTASTARTTLEVNSIDEDAEATGTKLVGPALYFDGLASVITVADDDKLSFTDGVNDLPFTVSAWIKCDDLSTEVPIITKYGTGKEFNFYVQDSDLALYLWDGTNSVHTRTTSTITGYNGQWIHVAATYSGTSGGVFSSAANGIKLFINGVSQTITATNNASYTGISNTSELLRLGARLGIFGNLHLRDAKIFNRELTDAEVAELARGNDLGFVDEFGGALGGAYTQDTTPSGEWNASQGTDADEAGPVGGVSDVLKFTANTASSTHYLQLLQFSSGKKHRVTFDYYIPSGQSNIDGIDVDVSGQTSIYTAAAPTLDSWNRVSFECSPTSTSMLILATDGGARTFADAGGDDVFYVANCTVTQIGKLADFRAEQYDTNTSKLYDLSDNAFVGTGTSVTLTGREVPVYETGTWTPTLTFGGGSTGLTYTSQEGFYTRIGNTVFATGGLILSAKGSSTGSAKIALPYTARNTTDDIQGVSVGRGLNMSGLTSAVTGYVVDNTTSCQLMDWGATGAVDLDEGNFTDTTEINISVTYQIS